MLFLLFVFCLSQLSYTSIHCLDAQHDHSSNDVNEELQNNPVLIADGIMMNTAARVRILYRRDQASDPRRSPSASSPYHSSDESSDFYEASQPSSPQESYDSTEATLSDLCECSDTTQADDERDNDSSDDESSKKRARIGELEIDR